MQRRTGAPTTNLISIKQWLAAGKYRKFWHIHSDSLIEISKPENSNRNSTWTCGRTSWISLQNARGVLVTSEWSAGLFFSVWTVQTFRKLENSFFNWTGVPSVFLSDDLSAMKEITKLAYQWIARVAASHSLLKSSRQRMICLSKILKFKIHSDTSLFSIPLTRFHSVPFPFIPH